MGNSTNRPIPKCERTQRWALVIDGMRRLDLGIYSTVKEAFSVGVTWSHRQARVEAEPIWVSPRHSDRIPYVPQEPATGGD
ncbi:MAG: hypothetical protein E6Q97_33970 [Desulfurellales bacterium]|nr:MAG: hypothetical protein E6Q97_33970 [Desulfurellales bacterium]